MVDVHVIPTPGFDDNLTQIIEALRHPMITVQVAEHIPGNMLEARWKAYNLGTNPYVSFVDGDDAVIDVKWISDAVYVLDEHPDVAAVYPRWYTTKNGKLHKVSPVHEWSPEIHRSFSSQPLAHHLTIMRRQNVIELLEEARKNCDVIMKSQDRYLISGMIRYGRLVSFDDIAYEWRLRDGTARSTEDSPEVTKWIQGRALGDFRRPVPD